jgi:peroxiredoxin
VTRPTGEGSSLPRVPNSRLNRSGLSVGTVAPIFDLPAIDGSTHRLDEWLGCPVLLVFSDPDCGPCSEVATRLEEVYRGRPKLKIVFISRGGAEKNRLKAIELGLTFLILLQRNWEISRDYAAFATPVGYMVDDRGHIAKDVAVGMGAILSLIDTEYVRSNTAVQFESVIRMKIELLTKEKQKGQQELAELERRRAYLLDTTLRITGAIQALDDLLTDVAAGTSTERR